MIYHDWETPEVGEFSVVFLVSLPPIVAWKRMRVTKVARWRPKPRTRCLIFGWCEGSEKVFINLYHPKQIHGSLMLLGHVL